MDATFASAKKGGFAVGPTRRGKGTKIVAIASGDGLPLAVSVENASPAEWGLVEANQRRRFIAAGSTNQFNGGNGSIWLVKTDSSGNISGCTDVQNDSATTASVAVKVSNGNLSPVSDGFSYVADSLIQSTAPLAATTECK